MADKAAKLSGGAWAVGGLVLLYVANHLSLQWFNFPFAYCWGSKLVGPVIGPWLGIANLIALAFFAYRCTTLNPLSIAIAGAAVVLVFSLPMMAEILFRQGAACG